MKKKRKYGGWLALLVVGAMLSFVTPALAVLELTLDQPKPVDNLQFYWGGDSSSPTLNGRVINTDPNISFDLSDPNKQAKVKASGSNAVFIFGADNGYPNSQTTQVRIWSGVRQTDNGTYTGLASYSNPAGTGVFPSLTINYLYIKAAPAKADITQYSETGTTIYSPPSISKKVTFTSVSGKVSGFTVEIGKSDWTITKNSGAPQTVTINGGTTFILPDNLAGDTMNANDSYKLKVKHYNLWGTAGPESDERTYIVGEGVSGGPITLSYKLTKPVGKNGVNTISIPFDFASGVKDENGDPITTVESLIKSINSAYASNAVTVFGWYDETTQTHVGLTGLAYTALNVIDTANTKYTGAASLAAITGASLVKGRCYQVTVNVDNVLTYKLTGTVK